MAVVDVNKILYLTNPLVQRIPEAMRKGNLHQLIGDLIEEADISIRLDLKEALDIFLHQMLENDASDIDLGGHGCDGKIWYRIFGDKKPLELSSRLPLINTDVLLHNILLKSQRETLIENKNLDFSYSISVGNDSTQRFRADMYFDLDHLGLNMRKIDNTIRPLKSLLEHKEVVKSISLKYLKYGLTLVTGITGSGKSSTLDSIIDANNRTVDSHIVIIASPIELIHEPICSVMRHREVGTDVKSFKDGAIQALRQDPDIIVIGELRDPETIMTALEITDSGHKIFGTLHTSSAMESIERILGEMPSNEQSRVRLRLADVLTCVICQKLVPSLDGKRVLAKEVLLSNASIRAAIRNNNIGEIYQMLMEGSGHGMNTMEQDLKRLYKEGKISRESALNHANNKTKMLQLISKVNY